MSKNINRKFGSKLIGTEVVSSLEQAIGAMEGLDEVWNYLELDSLPLEKLRKLAVQLGGELEVLVVRIDKCITITNEVEG